MLSEKEVTQWKNDGYVIIENFFSTEQTNCMRKELESMINAGLGSNVATDGDGKTKSTSSVNLQIHNLRNKSELFRSLPYLPHVKDAMIKLLGENVVFILDQIFFKDAKSGAATGWHTDNAYFNTQDVSQGTGMWVALHDANIENGTMRVIPGSHQKLFSHVRDMGSNHHITCKHEVNEEEAVYVEVPAGGVVFFNFGVAHATGPNPTDNPRAGAAFHFATSDLVGSESFWKGGYQDMLVGSNCGNDIAYADKKPDFSNWKS
jgi:phytanoyl-CoA hydroxylase